MVLSNTERRRMEQQVREFLKYGTLEDLLEHFDIEPEEAVLQLYEAGQIDPDDFERVLYDQPD